MKNPKQTKKKLKKSTNKQIIRKEREKENYLVTGKGFDRSR